MWRICHASCGGWCYVSPIKGGMMDDLKKMINLVEKLGKENDGFACHLIVDEMKDLWNKRKSYNHINKDRIIEKWYGEKINKTTLEFDSYDCHICRVIKQFLLDNLQKGVM